MLFAVFALSFYFVSLENYSIKNIEIVQMLISLGMRQSIFIFYKNII